MRILVVEAHADDCEIGAGGTIAMHRTREDDVHIICAIIPQESSTGNCDIGRFEERRGACQRAAGILGATITILNINPYHFMLDRYHVKLIDGHVREFVPDIVYTNWHKDSHQDHRIMANLVFSSARKNRFSLYMFESMVPGGIMPDAFRPQLFVKIPVDCMGVKNRALDEYGLVLGKGDRDAITGRAVYRGGQIGAEYAEAFEVVKEIRW